MTAIDPALAAAAREEVALRERKYPALVASGKLSDDEATIDYQAWHVIARLMETGQYRSIYAGGIDGQTEVGWLLAEQAAERTVTVVERALDEARAAQVGSDGAATEVRDPVSTDTKVAKLDQRLAQLRAILRIVARQRAQVEAINREFRRRREQERGKAAA
jgi:hypothetical protein